MKHPFIFLPLTLTLCIIIWNHTVLLFLKIKKSLLFSRTHQTNEIHLFKFVYFDVKLSIFLIIANYLPWHLVIVLFLTASEFISYLKPKTSEYFQYILARGLVVCHVQQLNTLFNIKITGIFCKTLKHRLKSKTCNQCLRINYFPCFCTAIFTWCDSFCDSFSTFKLLPSPIILL